MKKSVANNTLFSFVTFENVDVAISAKKEVGGQFFGRLQVSFSQHLKVSGKKFYSCASLARKLVLWCQLKSCAEKSNQPSSHLIIEMLWVPLQL